MDIKEEKLICAETCKNNVGGVQTSTLIKVLKKSKSDKQLKRGILNVKSEV